jgi:hypothetical protein
MTCHDPDSPAKAGASTGASVDGAATRPGDLPDAAALPLPAEETLKQLADALGVTTALLRRDPDAAPVMAGESVSLYEASALLQAFLAIEDAQTRQRCLAFVQDAARPNGRN